MKIEIIDFGAAAKGRLPNGTVSTKINSLQNIYLKFQGGKTVFTLTINGKSAEELFSNMEAILSGSPGVSARGNSPEAIPAQPDLTCRTPVYASTVPVCAPPVQAYTPPAPGLAANPVPTAAPAYTFDQLARAGATLAQSGKSDQVRALLTKYNIASLDRLNPEQYGLFAADLRALGAQL